MERREYQRHSHEFKLEAVRLAALGERPRVQIARELGILVNQLRKWRLEFEQKLLYMLIYRKFLTELSDIYLLT
ncbi:MAG TPA: transposase [Methyloradius sp.]